MKIIEKIAIKKGFERESKNKAKKKFATSYFRLHYRRRFSA